MNAPIAPFTVHIPDDVLADLRRRLDDTRVLPTIGSDARSGGLGGPRLQTMAERWREFDWHRCPASASRNSLRAPSREPPSPRTCTSS